MGSRRTRRTAFAVILVDTSFLIRAMVKGTREDRAIRRWLRGRETLVTSTIAWAEFRCGPLEPEDFDTAAMIVAERIIFDDADAVTAARFYNEAGRRRGTLIDCMIAATAFRAEADLATANPTDFNRLEPLGVTLVAY